MREHAFPKEKDIGGCAIAGIMSEAGRRFSGTEIIRAIANMRDRCNGLGGGFAAYGIYPGHEDHYALHVMYDSQESKRAAELAISARCSIHSDETIPTRPVRAIRANPLLHRYFVTVRQAQSQAQGQPQGQARGQGSFDPDDDEIVDLVMSVNSRAGGAFIFSSGKNMGVFKGVGFPEDIGEFYRLDEYEAHIWTAHGRFPTNTPGWWGGAHPFGLLDWTVVHNGEISSYGTNRRYLANFGYRCTLRTDTEVITYLFDLLMRKHGLPIEAACTAMAPPFWEQIPRLPPERQRAARALRIVYGGALLNGPFSVLVGHADGMIGFNDRIKLRPMVAARKGDMLYVASEEGAVREVCREPETVWHAEGGVPIIGRLKQP